MITKFLIDYPAYTGKEKRNVYIYLPKGYEKSSKRYPVLYMFDGHNVFYDKDATYGRSWRLGKYLDKNKIELVVVAVECHHGKNGEREIEYSPFANTRIKSRTIDCYGDETMKWFINKLKKKIDKEYLTLKDREHTYIMGSSMGGIMSTYALLKYNKYFSKACAFSPAYFLYPSKVYECINEAEVKNDSVLYTDYGTNDLYAKPTIPVFTKANTMMVRKGVNVTSRIVKDGEHREDSWEKQLVFAINVLMYE